MIAFVFALALCSTTASNLPNSTELSSAVPLAHSKNASSENSLLQSAQPEENTTDGDAAEIGFVKDVEEDVADSHASGQMSGNTIDKGATTSHLRGTSRAT